MGSSSGPGSRWLQDTRHPFCDGARALGGCRSPARPWPTAPGPPRPAAGSRPSSGGSRPSSGGGC
eukprot:12676961-Alexandrium_andersonii.AAC.1